MVLTQDKEKLKREEGRTIGAMKEICDLLELDSLQRVESYDISNISGFESVGSMVVYEKGKPKRNDYRKFKIKSVQGPDDYASMEEVLTRRFRRGIEEQKGQRRRGIQWFQSVPGPDPDGWWKGTGACGRTGTGGTRAYDSGMRYGQR